MGSLLRSREVLLWLQFGYAIWQFVRVTKFCRLPYALLVHTFMWLIGRWGRPFASRTYIVIGGKGEVNFYVPPAWHAGILSDRGLGFVEDRPFPLFPDDVDPNLRCLHIKAVDYKLCGTRRNIENNFVWNYLRDSPECFAVSMDLLYPGFAILDRISLLEGLKRISQGGHTPSTLTTRFLAVPDRDQELNQNFIRVLSIIPLIANARGYRTLSIWVSVGIITVDFFSVFLHWMWKGLKKGIVFLFRMFMIKTGFSSRTRDLICVFFSTMSTSLMYSDDVRVNFVRVKKGEMVYTKNTFNLSDFDPEPMPSFEFVARDPLPYSERVFGVYEGRDGSMGGIPEGAAVRSYYVEGSRIDAIFEPENRGFYNYVDNVAVHLGMYNPLNPENFEAALDLLLIMEEMKMLPLVAIEGDQFRSLTYRLLFDFRTSRRDLTFLRSKKNFFIGQ